MQNTFSTYLLYGKRFCGVEHSSQNADEILNATVLIRSKNELNIQASFVENTVEALAKKLPKHQHIGLVINNDMVLSKTIKTDQSDALKLVYSAFPNIDLEAFYFEVLSQKNIHFISICRKNYIDNLVEDYEKHKLSILNISLGSHGLINLIDFIEHHTIYTSNAKIALEQKAIIEIEKEGVQSENYDVNGIRVTNQQLLSFSGAMETILKNTEVKTNFTTEKNRLKDAYKQTRFFNQFSMFGGVFIFGLLVLNILFFNYYFNAVNALEQESEINKSTKNQIITLNEKVSKKQKMVEDLLKSNGSKSAFYSHTIIQSLPKTMLLTGYNYQPLLRRIKDDASIEISENTIVISGTSIKSAHFSEWINLLEQMEWIAKVTIVRYRNTSSKTSEFKISILILND